MPDPKSLPSFTLATKDLSHDCGLALWRTRPEPLGKARFSGGVARGSEASETAVPLEIARLRRIGPRPPENQGSISALSRDCREQAVRAEHTPQGFAFRGPGCAGLLVARRLRYCLGKALALLLAGNPALCGDSFRFATRHVGWRQDLAAPNGTATNYRQRGKKPLETHKLLNSPGAQRRCRR